MMFKVGDRVRVDTPEADFMCREESYLGDVGTVTGAYQEGCDVKIERNGERWSFSNKELTLVEPEISGRELPTLRDQFAMAALTGLIANSECARNGMEPTISYLANNQDGSWLAKTSYVIADAMMIERERAK